MTYRRILAALLALPIALVAERIGFVWVSAALFPLWIYLLLTLYRYPLRGSLASVFVSPAAIWFGLFLTLFAIRLSPARASARDWTEFLALVADMGFFVVAGATFRDRRLPAEFVIFLAATLAIAFVRVILRGGVDETMNPQVYAYLVYVAGPFLLLDRAERF
jgi:hypothetical protein